MGTMVDTTAMDFTVADPDTVTTWARGPLMPNLRPHPKPMLMLPLPTMVDTMAVDTMAVDTDTVTDTDITVKLLLKQQIFKSHISSPIIELSIYQTRLPPPPYIHPEKSEKYLDQK